MTDQQNLKPCPFCGSRNVDPEGWASTVRKGPACDDCGSSADTVAEWNTRPVEDLLLEALRDLITAVEAEVNEKGGGGFILARLTDARDAVRKATEGALANERNQ